MTRDEVIALAQEAGLQLFWEGWTSSDYRDAVAEEDLERFAALVAAQEREACAKLCDEKERANLYGVKECAAAIRARSKE